MRELIRFSIAACALGMLAPIARADDPVDMKDPVCMKHIKWGDKFGNTHELQPDGPADKLAKACKDGQGFVECPPAIAAIAAVGGKADPATQSVVRDFYHHDGLKDDGKLQKNGFCVARDARVNNWILGAVVFGLDDAKSLLLGLVDSAAKLGETMCGDKAQVARAIWYLGDKSALDALVATYDHALCTGDHIRNTMPLLPVWGLSAEQQAKVEKFCVDKIFGDGFKDNEKANTADSVAACYRFLGITKTKNADAIEYVRQGVPDNIEALRAIGNIDAAGNKKELQGRLAKWKQEKDGTDKKGKPVKIVTYQGRDEAIVGALAMGYADKTAKEAIDWWLGYNTEWKSLNDSNGWEQLFLFGAPFFAVDKKLLTAMEKAFDANKKLIEDNGNSGEEMINRAAIGLAQIGSAKGLETIKEVLGGTNADEQEMVLQGLGGITYLWGNFRWGNGGVKVGKDGVSVAQAQELIDLILKRFKFLKNKEAAALAVLDLRSRIRSATP